MPTINDPKQHTENHNTAKDQNAIIHALDIRVFLYRPHGPKSPEYGIHDCDDGYRDAEPAETEGAPGDLGVWRPEALVQHDGCGENEGGVVARYDKRDEGAEADR